MNAPRLVLPIVMGLVCLTLSRSDAAERMRDTIDRHIQAAWSEKEITPAPPASDAEFLRRIYLDLLGRIPTYDEAVRFLDDRRPDKRERLVDKLLDDPRFGVHQADLWDMVYFGRNPPGFGTDDRDGFKNWLRDQFNHNVPYDQWAGDILRAEGNTVEDGPPMFFVQYKRKPEDAIEAVTRRFLGVQLQCARCHDHPFDSWTQLDFYGMAAFLARLEVVGLGKKNKQKAYAIGEKNLGEIKFTGPIFEDEPGKQGKPVSPKFLNGQTLEEPALPDDFEEPRNFPSGKMPPEPKFSRKDALAEWITSEDNPYFARAAANRVWAQLMGQGIVHPVDNLGPNTTASHPQLLDDLTGALKRHDFDVKWLIREIVNSRTYQLSSRGPVQDAMPRWFQRARFRPLSAEELLESWVLAAGYDRVLEANGNGPKERLDIRGITWNYMRKFFGQPNDGEGNFQGGMHEHLYLNNGQVDSLISTKEGSLHQVLSSSERPWEERVERLFVQVLSRRPTPEETQTFVGHLTADEDTSGRLRDAIWTLMTCSEFRFNH